MPSHYGGNKHHQGGNGKLTQRQKDTMKRHSKHHSKKHMNTMSKLMKLKDMVQDMIDKGATSVEEIHRAIADMPFETLEKIEPLESASKSAKKIHDNTVGGVYDIIRKVNLEVGKLADELLDGIASLKDDEENY